jgi:hypothetical protein
MRSICVWIKFSISISFISQVRLMSSLYITTYGIDQRGVKTYGTYSSSTLYKKSKKEKNGPMLIEQRMGRPPSPIDGRNHNLGLQN